MTPVGEKIRKIRAMKGYSQEYMASKLNMSQNNYSRIELDQNKINLDRLHELAEVLGVDDMDILKFDDKYFFNSVSHNQTGGETKSGIFNGDDLVKSLREEIQYLRGENQRLLTILEKSKT